MLFTSSGCCDVPKSICSAARILGKVTDCAAHSRTLRRERGEPVAFSPRISSGLSPASNDVKSLRNRHAFVEVDSTLQIVIGLDDWSSLHKCYLLMFSFVFTFRLQFESNPSR